MEHLSLYNYRCSDCRKKFHISKLTSDCFDVNKLLCKNCYNMRSCDICTKELPLSWFHKDEYNYIICMDCNQYDIEKCDRCENLFYDKYLIFCNKEKQILCDRCYYYNFRQYENEKTEYIHNKQN